MTEENVNENGNENEDAENVNENENVNEESSDSGNQNEEESNEEAENDNEEADEEEESSEESGNVHTLSDEEYNRMKQNERLLAKFSEKEEENKPKVDAPEMIDVLKEQYPDVDEASIETIMKIAKTVADSQLKGVVETTSAQMLKANISDYATANGLDTESTELLTNVALKPEIRALIESKAIDIGDLEAMAYYKPLKAAMAKNKVKGENRERKGDVHTETKGKGNKSVSSSKTKSIKDMSEAESEAYMKSLGFTY